ncbi:phosphotransferase [Algibacter miyuki]|uniref:Phosphotransferase n=1 Tax=Algibacter miyuki TaxID=1306933 RepID=A0ABV5GW87_9FLAO|nr:phosphotransferase [Algibacter miyuki]MDN3665078.1 phosphotransferase [Algibacter miyuki]
MNTFPVTTSTISAKALEVYIKKQYKLDESYTCTLFRTGMNHTYFLSNKNTKFVLRVYCYNWRSKTEINEEITLLYQLKNQGLSVSFPIKDKNNTYIQDIEAPEGTRHAVLFSFAEGEKMRFMDNNTCFAIGALMGKFHSVTQNKTINRIQYNKNSLFELPFQKLSKYFSEDLPEMEFIKTIEATFQDSDFKNTKQGTVHLDIWYDNMSVANQTDITLFDFDFCGNGSQILDIGYFCKQLFHIETDKNIYEIKKDSFLEGYQKTNTLSEKELKLLPKAGLAVFIFYLGIQAQRFDWSNIFLSENYLKMYLGRLKSWMQYQNIANT